MALSARKRWNCLAFVRGFGVCRAGLVQRPNRTGQLPNGEFGPNGALPFSKAPSLWTLSPTLSWLSRGHCGIIPETRISLKKQGTSWRRGWDSNPRDGRPPAGFQDRCLQPLGHPSLGNSLSRRLPSAQQTANWSPDATRIERPATCRS